MSYNSTFCAENTRMNIKKCILLLCISCTSIAYWFFKESFWTTENEESKSNVSSLGFINSTFRHGTYRISTYFNPDFARDIYCVIFVISASKNIERRKVIRRTWGQMNLQRKLNFHLNFILGNPVNETKISDEPVKRELFIFKDVISTDIVEDYKHLTLKSILLILLAQKYYPTTVFTVKIDDDIFVNIFELMRYLRKVQMQSGQFENILCHNAHNYVVSRDPKNKWFISIQEYPQKYFPKYCTGAAYILPTKLLPKLITAMLNVPFLWVEDVYTTGILAMTANVSLVDMKFGFSFSQSANEVLHGYAIFNHPLYHMSTNSFKMRNLKLWQQLLEIEILP